MSSILCINMQNIEIKTVFLCKKKKDLKVAFTSQGTADKENASETARLSF